MGRAPETGDASKDRGRAIGRDPRDGTGNCRPNVTEVGTPLPNRVLDRVADDQLLSYGVPANGWPMFGRPTKIRSCMADHLPTEASEALLELATGGKPDSRSTRRAGGRPICASGRAAAIPGDEQRRGTGAGARVSVGQVDDLSPSGAARIGRTRFQRARAGRRFGGHGQDDRRPAPSCSSRAAQPGIAHTAHNLFGHAFERFAN